MGLEFSCLPRLKANRSKPLRKRTRQQIPPPPARRNRKIPPPPPRLRSATATSTKIIVSSEDTTNSPLCMEINPKNQTKIKNTHTHIQAFPKTEQSKSKSKHRHHTLSSFRTPSLQLHSPKPFNSNNLRVPKHHIHHKHHMYHNPNTNMIRKRSISRTITASAVSAVSSAASMISALSKASSAASSGSPSSTYHTSSHSLNSSGSASSFSSASSSSTNPTSMTSTTLNTDSECMMNGFSPITPESRTINCSQQPPSTQIISPTQTYNQHLHRDIVDIITDDDDEIDGSDGSDDGIDTEEIHRKYDEQIAVAQMHLNLQSTARQSNVSQISQLSALSQVSQISALSGAPSQISALSVALPKAPCNIVVKQAKKVKSDITDMTMNRVDRNGVDKIRGSPQSAPTIVTPLMNAHRDRSESNDSSLWHCPSSDDLDELDTDFEEERKLDESDEPSSYFSNNDHSEGDRIRRGNHNHNNHHGHNHNRSSFVSTISALSQLAETKLLKKEKLTKKALPEKLTMSAQLSSTLTASHSLSSCSSLPQPSSVKIVCEDFDMLQHAQMDKNKDEIQAVTPCSNIIKHSSDSPFDHLTLTPEMTNRSLAKSISLSMHPDDVLAAAYSPAGLSSSGDDSLLTSGKLDVEEITKYLQEDDGFDQFECISNNGQYVD